MIDSENIMKNLSRVIFILFLLFSLCSCGFSPLHSPSQSEYNHELQQIYIEPANSIADSGYYEAMQDLLQPGKETKYVLITTLRFDKGISVLLPNSDVLHEKVTVYADYHLTSKDTGNIITSGSVTRALSYSTTFAPYTNYVRSEDSSIKAARSIAEAIRNKLLFYFINTDEDIQQQSKSTI